MGILRPDMGKVLWAVGGLLLGPKLVQMVRGAAGR